MRADEKLTAFVELERAIYEIRGGFDLVNHFVVAVWRAKAAESAVCKSKWVTRTRRLQSCNNLIIDGDSAR